MVWGEKGLKRGKAPRIGYTFRIGDRPQTKSEPRTDRGQRPSYSGIDLTEQNETTLRVLLGRTSNRKVVSRPLIGN